MKLSTKSRYGLRAIIDIARAYGSGIPAKRKEISENQGISGSYLENILIVLKNSRIIETTRGMNGGYVLCKPPEEITVLEVLNALEGPLDLVDCVSSSDKCSNTSHCVTRTVWMEMSQLWEKYLGSLTLKDLVDKGEYVNVSNYSI